MLKHAVGPAAAVVLVGIAAGITYGTPRPESTPAPARPAAVEPALQLPVSTVQQPQPVAVDPKPVRLMIPAISLDAKIEARGLDAKRNLDTARDPNDVAWYDLGPMPGQQGNAIINGHVDWWTGDAVFTRLGRVRPGDTVEVVRADGRIITFRITLLQRVGAGTRLPSLFAKSSQATLTLITCAGVWNPLTLTNTERLLVSANAL
jgi:LPXTG-site transpeptidase (sortase) family protein